MMSWLRSADPILGDGAPLRNARLVTLALLANFVLMPLGALALTKGLRLDEPLGVGLLLLACAAGAPFLPKLAHDGALNGHHGRIPAACSSAPAGRHYSQSGEDRAIARAGDVVALRHRARGKGALR